MADASAAAALQAAADRVRRDRGVTHGDADLGQAGDHVAHRVEPRHAGPLVLVDQEHAVVVVRGAEADRELRAPAQPESGVDRIEPEHLARAGEPGADDLAFGDEIRDRLVDDAECPPPARSARSSAAISSSRPRLNTVRSAV